MKNLDEVFDTFVVEDKESKKMCASSSDTLILDNVSEYPLVASGVDCSGPGPFYSDVSININSFTTSLCCVQDQK